MTTAEVTLMITAIMGIITGLGGLLYSLYNAQTQAKKTEVDILRVIIEEQDKEITQLRDRLAAQAVKITKLEAQNEKLRQRVLCLEKENRYLKEKYENKGD